MKHLDWKLPQFAVKSSDDPQSSILQSTPRADITKSSYKEKK